MFLGLTQNLMTPRAVQAFRGPLDAYTTNMVALYGTVRMLASYSGSAIRVRRSSDSTLQDIGFNADGSFDATSYAAFIGGGNGFAHTVYDQSGNGRNQVQATAAAQPQIAVDGNGQYYLYAPGAGNATTSMSITGLSLTMPEFTIWSVAGASAIWLVPITLRENSSAKERAVMNYGSSLVALMQDNGTGTVPGSITITTSAVYSSVFSGGAGGCKMTNRLTTNTGTRVPSSLVIDQMFIGRVSGGAAWLQNAPFYCGGVWSTDYGPTANFAALAEVGNTLFTAVQ